MINNISSWAEQVIIAMIIATIIEMILPKGNSKKYIKMVIGIYILYTIICPVITLFNGGDIKIDYSKYDEYFANTDEYKMLEEKINDVSTNSIEHTYKEELKKQIQNDIKDIGFNLENIEIELDLNTGEISYINLTINKLKKENNANNIYVNKIKIGETKIKNTLSKQEIEKIKDILKNKYNINSEKITVNSI